MYHGVIAIIIECMKLESGTLGAARKYCNYSRRSAQATFALLALLTTAPLVHAQTRGSFTDQVADRVIVLVNEFRAEHRLRPLETEQRLRDASRYFAGYLAKTGRLDHHADGASPAARAKQRGYEYCVLAENLAYEYHSAGFTAEQLARNLVQGWKESPTHRANMLEPDVTQTGVNIVPNSTSGEYYAVQMFGRPATERIAFHIVNRARSTIRYEFGKRSFSLAPLQVRTHETCVASNVTIDWPGTQKSATVQPRNGGRYTLLDAGKNAFQVIQE